MPDMGLAQASLPCVCVSRMLLHEPVHKAEHLSQLEPTKAGVHTPPHWSPKGFTVTRRGTARGESPQLPGVHGSDASSSAHRSPQVQVTW